MSIELKIKAKSLADEARTIRLEERRLKAQRKGASREFQSIYLHRVGIVRREARATHLARAYLSGLSYRQVEAVTRLPISDHVIKSVARMVERYGSMGATPDLSDWFSEPQVMKEAA